MNPAQGDQIAVAQWKRHQVETPTIPPEAPLNRPVRVLTPLAAHGPVANGSKDYSLPEWIRKKQSKVQEQREQD